MLVLLLLIISLINLTNSFPLHGWDSSHLATFCDMSIIKRLTDDQATFVAKNYRVISIEKCSGEQDGISTEEMIYSTAYQLKKLDPSLKIFFYWATDQQGLRCYDANDEFLNHPEWHLKDDNGNVYDPPILDFNNPNAANWWLNIPIKGTNNTQTWNNISVFDLIDGVLADSDGYSQYANFSVQSAEKFIDSKFNTIKKLQDIFTAKNDGIVMANGINMYTDARDPRYPDNNVHALKYSRGIMNEHTAVFEEISSANSSINVELCKQDLDSIEKASQIENSFVFISTWPGPYTNVDFYPKPDGTPAKVYPDSMHTPQNNDEWRAALRKYFTFNHALYLTLAQPNVYWFYGAVWYESNEGYIACPEDTNSCPAPPEWYPDLVQPLGKPLNNRTEVEPYVYTREFENCSVRLDLKDPSSSYVKYHSKKAIAPSKLKLKIPSKLDKHIK